MRWRPGRPSVGLAALLVIAWAAVGEGQTAEATFASVEQRLLARRALHLRFDATASLEGRVLLAMQGTLEFDGAGAFRLVATGESEGDATAIEVRATPRTITILSGEDSIDVANGGALHEAVVVGLLRAGLLHNLMRAANGQAPDRHMGDIRDLFLVERITFGDPVSAAGGETRPLSFAVRMGIDDRGQAEVMVDARSGLPVSRRQSMRLPAGTFTILEHYVERPTR